MRAKMDFLNKNIEIEKPIEFIMNCATGFYLCIILCYVIPYYYTDKYFNIGDDKWIGWIATSTIYVAIVSMLYVVRAIKNKKKNRSFSIPTLVKDSITDYFALAYIGVCIVSAIFSPYKEMVWYGAKDWNMGLWSQLIFILVYFYISRTESNSKIVFVLGLIASIGVFILEIVMRFGWDPLNLYEGLDTNQRLQFISTIGQATWYSSYLVLIIPIFVIIYCNTSSKQVKFINGFALSILFMSIVTQNSDCAYLAYGAVLLFLFWISFDNNKKMVCFWEVIIITLASWKIVGLCQKIMEYRIDRLDTLSMELSQGIITWFALMISLIIYIWIRISAKKDKFNIVEYKWIRKVVVSIVIGFMVIVFIYIVLNTLGLLDDSISSRNKYLYFSNAWGESRGYIWKMTIQTLTEEPAINWVIGTGPDTFGPSIYRYVTHVDGEMMSFFMNHLVSCAHNEWMNTLVTGGILGLITYVGIFVTSLCRCLKYAKKDYRLYGFAMALAAYVVHDFFCYQQVVGTSVIFIFMGICEWMIRHTQRVDAEKDDYYYDNNVTEGEDTIIKKGIM